MSLLSSVRHDLDSPRPSFGPPWILPPIHFIKVGNQFVRLGTNETKIRKRSMMIRKGITPRETSLLVDFATVCMIERFIPSGGEISASSILITMTTAIHNPLNPSPVTKG